jgi:hypothetical protein
MAERQAQTSLENMGQAEEGTLCGNCNRTAPMLDAADESEHRPNTGLALSTVASVGDVHSPIRRVYSPSETNLSAGKSANAGSSR